MTITNHAYGAFDVRGLMQAITAPIKARCMKWEAPLSKFRNMPEKVVQRTSLDEAMDAAKLKFYELAKEVEQACGDELWKNYKEAHLEYLKLLRLGGLKEKEPRMESWARLKEKTPDNAIRGGEQNRDDQITEM